MKIYAITKGVYSDYHICTLTTNKDKAEKLRTIYSDKYGEAYIEEFEDGENEEIRIFWDYYPSRYYAEPSEYNHKEEIVTNWRKEITCVTVLAQDVERAKKKAQDMIAEYKAKKAGIL